MSHPDPRERARENASGIVAILVTGLWLALMLAGFEYWLPFILFGYIVIVPLVAILFDEDGEQEWSMPPDADTHSTSEDATGEEDDALAKLRERNARGELTDDQFERKVKRLLETETQSVSSTPHSSHTLYGCRPTQSQQLYAQVRIVRVS